MKPLFWIDPEIQLAGTLLATYFGGIRKENCKRNRYRQSITAPCAIFFLFHLFFFSLFFVWQFNWIFLQRQLSINWRESIIRTEILSIHNKHLCAFFCLQDNADKTWIKMPKWTILLISSELCLFWLLRISVLIIDSRQLIDKCHCKKMQLIRLCMWKSLSKLLHFFSKIWNQLDICFSRSGSVARSVQYWRLSESGFFLPLLAIKVSIWFAVTENNVDCVAQLDRPRNSTPVKRIVQLF